MEDKSFITKIITAFSHVQKEMEKASLEHDMRPRFVKYFVEQVLGYCGSDYRYEKKRTDITIFDENKFAIIKIETKKPSMSIEKPEFEEQAFKYEEETTKYIGLTNFVQFKLWEVSKTTKELKINLDFSNILERKDQLSTDEKSQLLFFTNLTKEILFDSRKYEKFDETYKRIDITKDAGFKKLLDRLNFIVNDLMMGYTLKAFGEYKEGYNKYLTELQKVDTEVKNNKGNRELNHNIIRYRQQIDEKYKRYLSFSGFGLWKQFSGKENVPDDNVKEVFCKETIYVLLNKLLFIRICEDKELLPKNISNGGIEDLRKHFTGTEDAYKEILHVAYRNAKKFYTHFYEPGILDWYMEGDSELNEILNKVLWILNQFDFTHVDRDILGNLYEKYLPGDERKKLGEFYTPVEVIDYILTSVGYTYSYDVESKDLLDPACGSGGFIVRATRRLISRYLIKFNKADKKELRDPKNWREIVDRLSPSEAKIILEAIQEHIYGLDINPFACHIAEMNMLFQVIDLYKKAREHYKDYKLGKFKIYRTDSLELAKDQRQIFDFTHKEFLEEQEEIDAIKQKKFDFVVGNPPWGGILKREKGTLLTKRLKEEYVSAIGKYDIYVLFIERGINWLKDGGQFGYIVQNRFLRVDYGKKLREYLLDNVKIEKIVDFGDTKVFADATNYPAIIIFERKIVQDHEFPYIDVCPKANKLSADEVIDLVKSYSPKSEDYLTVVYINQQKLKALKAWTPAQIFINSVIKKIKNIETLSNVTEEIMEGVTFGGSGSDSIFIIDKNTIKNHRIESKMYKKVVKGRDIRKWKLEWDHRYLFYPYDSDDKEVKIEQYPNAFEYIKQFKDQLSDRVLDGKNITKWGKQWFSLWRIRNPAIFKKQKILSPRLSTENSFTLDGEGDFYLTDSAVAIIPKNIDIKYLLGILNSNFLFFIVKNTSPFVQGRYYSFTRTYLDDLPIKISTSSEEKKIADKIIKKVDEIIELHKMGILDIDVILEGKETEKICNLSKVTFSLRDETRFELVKVKDDQIYINSQDFVEVKDKKIREYMEIYFNCNSDKFSKSKDVKNMILNIPVPKSDEIIKEIIKKGSVNYPKVKEKIQRLEQEINDLVYELYGLNKKEIAIVEESLK